MIILINATASKSGGALSIARDFFDFLTTLTDCDQYYIITCSSMIEERYSCVKNLYIHKLPQQNWISRIIWDEKGLKRYCKKSNIVPDIIISLQNTCVNYGKIKQFVYYHQTLPLYKYKWSLFNINEFILFLYAKFYPFFVRRNNKNAYYVVQLPCIKEMFIEKYKRIDSARIRVVKPNLPLLKIYSVKKQSENKFVFFFPATSISYKNHSMIIDALVAIEKVNSSFLDKIRIDFTVDKLDKRVMKKIEKSLNPGVCNFLGQLSYEEVVEHYYNVDALLFPSKIESFGLPLYEAASTGLPIIASDLPYAHEVLSEYQNVEYIDPDDYISWSQAMSNYMILKRKDPLKHDLSLNTWKYFDNYIKEIVNDT